MFEVVNDGSMERVRTCPACERIRNSSGKCKCGAPAHPVFVQLRPRQVTCISPEMRPAAK